jgi:hypothetical protein
LASGNCSINQLFSYTLLTRPDTPLLLEKAQAGAPEKDLILK